jgi:hypothetical protein
LAVQGPITPSASGSRKNGRKRRMSSLLHG